MSFLEIAAQFHFLRPLWLLALCLVPLVLWLSTKGHTFSDSDWNKAIPPELLQHLMVGDSSSSTKSQQQHWKWFAIIIAVLSLALAGPTWLKKPQPLQQQNDNLAIVLDLSLSMLASDQKPNRLTRAKHKLRDILDQRKEGNTALVVYSGDSYVVTPLTDDTNTLKSMLPPLDPFIMPAMGSRPDLAIKQAIEVLKNGGGVTGKILLITDGIEESNLQQINDLLKETRYPLSVLAVGTEEGGPINIPDRGYLKDKGSVIIPKTDFDRLEQLASNHSGVMTPVSFDDSDIDVLKSVTNTDPSHSNTDQDETDNSGLFDQWHDAGYLFALFLIPIVLLGYRKGAFSLVLLLTITLQPNDAMAFEWQDLWQTPDQQAMNIVDQDPAKAAELFQDPAWKGAAHYKAQQYEQAQQSFEAESSTTALYNKATALAQQQKFEEAIETYNEVLNQDPDFEDAATNKALIEKFLEEQPPQDQQSSDQDNSDNKDQQESQDQNQDQNQQSDQNQQGENSDSQNQQNQQQSPSDSSESDPSDQSQSGQDSTEQSSQDQQSQDQPSEKQSPEQADQNESEQSSPQQTNGQDSTDQPSGEPKEAQAELTDEETQAFEQWMRRVPDDPGGLLRRKFSQQYQQKRGRQSQQEGQPIW